MLNYYPVFLDQQRVIFFESGEDALIYFGMMSMYTQLAEHFQAVHKRKLTNKDYFYYQAQGQKFRTILENTALSDGSILKDVVKGRFVL
jgi:hypothetical protein